MGFVGERWPSAVRLQALASSPPGYFEQPGDGDHHPQGCGGGGGGEFLISQSSQHNLQRCQFLQRTWACRVGRTVPASRV